MAGGALSADKAASLYHEAQTELGKKKAMAGMVGDAEAGMLGFYDPKDQNKVLDQLVGPTAKAMWQAAVGGDSRQVQALAQVIMQKHSQTGATVPVDNPEAGMNIGAGYNLKANVANVDGDLKRAGVPADRIADVKSGKASLTPDQVKYLIRVSVPRYEEQPRKIAESAAPGLWQSMTPAQRAVMVDINYQTGDAAQFKKAWSALAAGKTQEFSDETRVFYKNKAGERVEDRRARELRASMLAGLTDWNTRVQMASR